MFLLLISLFISNANAQININGGGYFTWNAPVANASLLPITGNIDGDERVALDTNNLYSYNKLSNSWVLQASPASENAITALTGDVHATGPGAVIGTIQPNVVSNSKLAQAPANTIKGNNTGSTANDSDLTVSQVNTMLGLSSTYLPLAGGTVTGNLTVNGDFSAQGTNLILNSSNEYLGVNSFNGTIQIGNSGNSFGMGVTQLLLDSIGPIVIGGGDSSDVQIQSDFGVEIFGGGTINIGNAYGPYDIVMDTFGNIDIGNDDAQNVILDGETVDIGSGDASNIILHGQAGIQIGEGGDQITIESGAGVLSINPSNQQPISIGGSTASYPVDVKSFQSAIRSGSFISGTTKFTISGCSASATVGGSSAGKFTSGTTGTCTVVITISGIDGTSAPNGWTCFANDQTTPADKITTIASTTGNVTLSGTTLSGDVISFGCMGY